MTEIEYIKEQIKIVEIKNKRLSIDYNKQLAVAQSVYDVTNCLYDDQISVWEKRLEELEKSK